jgi:hypothetical protein
MYPKISAGYTREVKASCRKQVAELKFAQTA